MFGPSLISGNFLKDIIYIFIILTGGTFGAFYYSDNFKNYEIEDPQNYKETVSSMKNPENLSYAQNLKY